LIFGRQHPEKVLTEFIGHYQEARPHHAPDQRRPIEAAYATGDTGPRWIAVIGLVDCSTSTIGPREEVTQAG
jgi:hypothetical protein